MIPEPITREEKFLKEIYDAASGGGSDATFRVTITATSPTTGTADHTNGEIYEALTSGRKVLLVMDTSGMLPGTAYEVLAEVTQASRELGRVDGERLTSFAGSFKDFTTNIEYLISTYVEYDDNTSWELSYLVLTPYNPTSGE